MKTEERIRVEDEQAAGLVERFGLKYGDDVLELAHCAAFSMTLTTNLVGCLRENFVPDVPWYGCADVLLGGLCEPIGYDLYEMTGAVRRVLLGELGEEELRELTEFMRVYVGERLRLEGDRARVLGEKPEWTALPYLYGDEGKAWEHIKQELMAMVWDADQRERLYIISLLESYGQSLLPRMEQPILQWVEGVENGTDLSEVEAMGKALKVKFGPVSFETAQVGIGEDRGAIDPMARKVFEYETVQVDRRGAIVQRQEKTCWGYVERLGDIGLDMVAIPGGEFVMGSPEDEPERYGDEGPQHRVTVKPFFMGRFVVTQAQWRVVAGWEKVDRDLELDPSRAKGGDRPVTNVNWAAAVEFCARLSRETGRDYRLPSEAMWEYACRAGTKTAFSFGEMISPEVANYNWDRDYDGVKFEQAKDFRETVDVGRFPANPWGLYEMHGNVWEWCEDHWHGNYEGAPTDGSVWASEKAESQSSKVLRGGSWLADPRYCRSATRISSDFAHDNIGFRLVCLPPRTR